MKPELKIQRCWLERGPWQSYALVDGLPDVNVRVVLQDRNGYLWLGTEHGGVSRYDGYSFETVTIDEGLLYRWIWSILEERERQRIAAELHDRISQPLAVSKISLGSFDGSGIGDRSDAPAAECP